MLSLILNYLNKKKNFPYFFITPLPYAIGNASEQILLAANKAKNENKKLVIIYTNFFTKILKYHICNKSLFKDIVIKKDNSLPTRLLSIFLKFFLEFEFFFKRTFVLINDLSFKLNISENNRFLNIGIPIIYETIKIKVGNLRKKKFNLISPFNINYHLVSIKKKIEIDCKNKLDKFGFQNDYNYICLHVRDDKYRKDRGRKIYRNANINNYIEGIKFLLKKELNVIRIGDTPNNKIKFNNKNFLEYSKSNIKSPAMDLYLIKNCKFYIGMQSGVLDTAYLFNKPVLTTNMCELFSSYPRKQEDKGLFKKILTKKGKQIKIKDFMNLPYRFHNPENEIKELRFVENTSEEIYESIKEFYFNILNKNEVTNLQKKFNQIVSARFEKMFYESQDNQSLLSQTDGIKMIRMFKESKGHMLNYYLKINF